MKKIFLTLLILLVTNSVSAFEIVYPKSDEVIINSDKTFFVGNECSQKSLTINGEIVKIHDSGAFFHPVKLNLGENIFEFDNGEFTKIYKITRQEPKKATVSPKFINYNEPQNYIVTKDNTPLRSTPYDSGLNRLAHYEKGIPLKVVGEYGDFYKVQLARDDYAWVAKNNVTKTKLQIAKLVKIRDYIYEETPQKRVFKLKLSEKTPYVLSELSNLELVVYNVEGFYQNKYEFQITKLGASYGYKAYYTEGSTLVVEVKNPPIVEKNNPLLGKTITIDAGHGGSEYGAIGCLGDKEKDVNLEIALQLKEHLESVGANVVMTRTDDENVPLTKRVEISQQANSDIFISIHNNALPDALAYSNRSGSSVYWFYPQSKPLANKILEALTKELGMANDKVRAESFAVIRNSESLAVLIEIGYMINPDDNAKLIDVEFQQAAAKAILHGLENYLNDL